MLVQAGAAIAASSRARPSILLQPRHRTVILVNLRFTLNRARFDLQTSTISTVRWLTMIALASSRGAALASRKRPGSHRLGFDVFAPALPTGTARTRASTRRVGTPETLRRTGRAGQFGADEPGRGPDSDHVIPSSDGPAHRGHPPAERGRFDAGVAAPR